MIRRFGVRLLQTARYTSDATSTRRPAAANTEAAKRKPEYFAANAFGEPQNVDSLGAFKDLFRPLTGEEKKKYDRGVNYHVYMIAIAFVPLLGIWAVLEYYDRLYIAPQRVVSGCVDVQLNCSVSVNLA
jgi:hypothetical protein